MKFVFDLKCIIIRQPMLIFKKGEVFLCSITRFLNYFEKKENEKHAVKLNCLSPSL